MEENKKTTMKALHENLVDLVIKDDKPHYLLLEEGKLQLRSQIKAGDALFVPPPIESLPHSESLCEAAEVLEATQKFRASPDEALRKIYEDLYRYLTELSQMPDEAYYALLAVWALHTYLYEWFNYTPIIVLFAVVERGKSRTGKGLMHVSYRGLTINSLRESFIFRMAESLGSTMFLDISQFRKVMERALCEDMLLARFEKSATVPRVNHPDRGALKDITYYKVYGPTVIGTNQALTHALNSRSITIVMPESERMFSKEVTPEAGKELRTRLLAFRAHFMRRSLPEVDKPTRGRLGDIAKPLLQTALLVGEDVADTVLALIKKIEQERMEDKSQTNEAAALRALVASRDKMVNGKLALELVRDLFNATRPLESQYSAPSFGRLLKSLGLNPGGRKYRTSDGSSAIPWNAGEIERVCRAYGIDVPPEKTPEPSEAPESHSKTVEKQGAALLDDMEDLDDKRGTIGRNYGE